MSILWSAASRSEATSDDSSLANLRTGESPRMNSILDDIFATTLSSRRTKPLEQTSRRLSTLHELVIKLACSNLSDVSIDDTLYPAIGAQLGTGATFSVESREAKGRKLVAVKHIEKTLLATSGYSCTGPTRKRLEAVLLEVYALLHLGSLQHRNIVELLGFGWDEGPLPYLVLEFADLGTLDGFLAKNELSSSQKEQIMLYLASGLELIHACGIIHGDVKLENILVFSDPPNGFNVKYADFGFCCSDTLGRREYHGTSVFNAPEIRRQVGRPAAETEHDFKEADVYSYGLAAWEIANDGRRYYSVDAIGISLEESHAERALSFLSELDSKNQELFKFAVMFLQDLELPPSISAPLSTVMEMSLQRDPLSRAEIRDIRLVLDPENEYEPEIAIPLGAPRYSIFDISTAPIRSDVREDLAKTFREGSRNHHNEHRGSDAFNLAAFYAIGFGILLNDHSCFENLESASKAGYLPAAILSKAFAESGLTNYPGKMADHLDWGQLVDGLPEIPASVPRILQFQHRIRAYYKHLNRSQAFCHFSIGERTFSLQEFLEYTLQLQELEHLLELEIELDFAGERITRPLLHHLVRTQDEIAETLLRKGMHGSSLTDTNESLLHVACECGSVRIVRTLLERYPELARENTQEGISPLHWLFMFEEAELHGIAKELRDHGASINRVGVRFLTEFNLVFSGPPLHWAIMARNISAVKVLIDLGADVNVDTPAPKDCLEYSGFSIDVATCLLMSEIVELLISRGAQIYHPPDGPGMSALHYVGETIDPFRLWLYHGPHIREAAKDTMEVLFRNGAKLEAVDVYDPAPLQWIVNRTTCITSVLESFLTYDPTPPENILYSAAVALQHDRFNSRKMALLLDYCSRRLDPETFTVGCMDALRICVQDGTVGAAKEILSRHSLDAKDIIHEEELVHAAAENDHAEMIEVLLGYGVDVDLDRGGTAAAVACHFSKRKALGFLLSRGASVLSLPSEGSSTTLLHYIVTNRSSPHESERTLKFVCDKFPEKFTPVVDNYDDKGLTALHEAIIWGNINNINHLMANLNASGLPIRDTDVSPTTLAALCRERPPWLTVQQDNASQMVYKKQLSFIIDYLVDTMRLNPPNRTIKNHNVEKYWTTPEESRWFKHEQLSDWYIKPEYPYTKVDRTASNWWGVRWRAQSCITETLDTAEVD